MLLPKKTTCFLLVVLVFAAVLTWIVFHSYVLLVPSNLTTASSSKIIATHGACLENYEYVDYKINKKIGEASTATISIKDKNTNKEVSSFEIEVPLPGHYHPVEIHKCGVYAVRDFNYDEKKGQALSNYHVGLWQYSYNGEGKELVALGTMSGIGFGTDFRVDTLEHYLVLVQSSLGQPGYAFVIRDLTTNKDALVLKLADLIKQYSSAVAGEFGLGWWTEDDKYLLGDIYDGALDAAYYRIEMGTWKVDIYLSPPELWAGVERSMNYDRGYLAYVDIPTFTGIQEVADQLVEQARKEGRQKNLFLYNFATKQTTKVASIDPRKRFDLHWVSSSALQYTLPSGATTTYTIPQ